MRNSRKTIGDRLLLWVARTSVVGTVDGVRLADVRGPASFKGILERALGLIRQHDPRRYARVTRYIHWILNQATPDKGMSYNERIHLCLVEFFEMPGLDKEVLAAFYACALVHESTHGLVASYEIPYNPETRARIERLCVIEQNRFASRLAAVDSALYPIELLHIDFDEGIWKNAWTESRLKTGLSLLHRVIREK
jgi:hypothetical protein